MVRNRYLTMCAATAFIIALTTVGVAQDSSEPSRVVVAGRTVHESDLRNLVKAGFPSAFLPYDKEHSVTRYIASIAPCRHLGQALLAYMLGHGGDMETRRCGLALKSLQLLSADKAGPFWHEIFAATPQDDTSRGALGLEIADAFLALSPRLAEHAEEKASFIKNGIVVGMTRDETYALLRSRGIEADFHVKKLASRQGPPVDDTILLYLGAKDLAPGCSITAGISFDSDDSDARVKRVSIVHALPACS